ncbi:MAG: transglutaminaseTgpA domain-containing protein, partial [Acidimicrobiales bacterium]
MTASGVVPPTGRALEQTLQRQGASPPTPVRHAGPAPKGGDRRRPALAWDLAGAAALLALTLASAAGFVRVYTGHGWLGPVFATAIAAHAVSLAARRRRVPAAGALVVGAGAVWLVAVWTILGASTHYGVPTSDTLTQFSNALTQARVDFASAAPPAMATTGFKLITALGVGAVAVAGDWTAFRRGGALFGAVPGFALFVVCCAFGTGSGRQWAIIVEVVALVVYLLVHHTVTAMSTGTWFAASRAGVPRWALSAGSVAAVATVAAAVVLAPAIGGADGRGILGWRSGAGGSGGGPREVANPIVDLHARLLSLSDVVVFTVRSPVPSYWRLTSLDTFTGEDWTATDSYRGFRSRLPGARAVPPGARTVVDNFDIQNLDSVWLPDAFTPLSVYGVHGVSYDPVSGSLLTSARTSNGLDYTVESYQYLSTLNGADLAAAPPVGRSGSLDRYLRLPDSVPKQVFDLAHEITSSQSTEYGKALALQNFFLGPEFQYSLNPPDNGFGVDALTNFLFKTHSGYCQQFAGAYAVLARAAGLPTRLAVGFATGTDEGGGVYQVLDADAHTWPEVYFGPRYGWIPFEPTKSFTNPSATGYAGANGGSGASKTTSADTLPIAPKNGITQGAAAKHAHSPAPNPASGAGGFVATPSGSHGSLLAGILLALAAIASWATANVLGRRLRWLLRRWRGRRVPGAPVLASWADTVELLEWWGIARRPAETDVELAARAGRSLGARSREPVPWVARGLSRL